MRRDGRDDKRRKQSRLKREYLVQKQRRPPRAAFRGMADWQGTCFGCTLMQVRILFPRPLHHATISLAYLR